MFGRRGPGLVRAAATTAVVAGTAGAVRHRQDQKYAAQDQAAYDQQMAAQQQAAPATCCSRRARLRRRARAARAAEEPGNPDRGRVPGEEEADPRNLSLGTPRGERGASRLVRPTQPRDASIGVFRFFAGARRISLDVPPPRSRPAGGVAVTLERGRIRRMSRPLRRRGDLLEPQGAFSTRRGGCRDTGRTVGVGGDRMPPRRSGASRRRDLGGAQRGRSREGRHCHRDRA